MNNNKIIDKIDKVRISLLMTEKLKGFPELSKDDILRNNRTCHILNDINFFSSVYVFCNWIINNYLSADIKTPKERYNHIVFTDLHKRITNIDPSITVEDFEYYVLSKRGKKQK